MEVRADIAFSNAVLSPCGFCCRQSALNVFLLMKTKTETKTETKSKQTAKSALSVDSAVAMTLPESVIQVLE